MAIFRCVHCRTMNRLADDRLRDKALCGGCRVALDTSGAPQEVQGDAFSLVIAGSPVPILVDFWAGWCAPCRLAAPAVAEVAKRNAGKVLVLKLDVDADQGSAAKHHIQSIPAFVVFHGGREVARRAGVTSSAELEAWMHGAVARAG